MSFVPGTVSSPAVASESKMIPSANSGFSLNGMDRGIKYPNPRAGRSSVLEKKKLTTITVTEGVKLSGGTLTSVLRLAPGIVEITWLKSLV